MNPEGGKDDSSFSITFKHPQTKYERLRLDVLTNSTEMIIVDFAITDNLVQEISINEYSYFQLDPGQSLRYLLIPVEEASQKDRVRIRSNAFNGKVKVSESECSAVTGCNFTVEADNQSVRGYLYSYNESKSKDEVEFKPIKRYFKGKGKLLENVYLNKTVRKGKSFRVNINTPNAIMYGAMDK